MKISVITAVYNRKESIRRSLLSIKNQTYKNIEIIVIDGDSDDGSQEIAKEVLEDSDTLISEPDKGIYDALNKGIKIATGDIISFLHSDDIFDNDQSLSLVAQSFEKKIDVVYGNVSFFSSGNVDKVTRMYQSDNLSIKNLSWGKMPAHPAIFIRKYVYDKIGLFKTDYKIAADYEFLCRMMTSLECNLKKLPDYLVKMQVGGVSTRGLSNTILLNKEVLRACRDNNLKTNIFMIFSKYPSKLLQFMNI